MAIQRRQVGLFFFFLLASLSSLDLARSEAMQLAGPPAAFMVAWVHNQPKIEKKQKGSGGTTTCGQIATDLGGEKNPLRNEICKRVGELRYFEGTNNDVPSFLFFF